MKKILKIAAVFFVLGAGSILFALSHQIGGLRAFVVSSGSMEPAIATGSLIITQYTHPSNLKTGEVITFIAPIKEREFVTHRIAEVSQKDTLTVIKTKGDHNKQNDNWIVAGGGVVGKELLAIPFLGFFFSFTQTKIGILLVILLPSLYIIFSELEYLFTHLKKKTVPVVSSPIIGMAFGIGILTILPFTKTFALLSDTVTLSNNTFTIASALPSATPTPSLSPTITPTMTNTPAPTSIPTPVATTGCNVSILGNEPGSMNEVNCGSQTTHIVTKTNTTTVNNTVVINTDTGGNSQ